MILPEVHRPFRAAQVVGTHCCREIRLLSDLNFLFFLLLLLLPSQHCCWGSAGGSVSFACLVASH